jgi:mannosyl-oligosaccharide alpha-1,2-mannosidase
MVPGSHDILFAGSFSTDGKDPEKNGFRSYETDHLTCFIGGMVGMAAKIFDIDGDLEIAKKLTDGCVWAYGSMNSDIMAESAEVMPCDSMEHCTWNETAYYAYLDPMGDDRDRKVEEYLAKKAAESEKKAIEDGEKGAEADKKATTNDKTTEGDDKTTKVEKKESEKAAEGLTEAASKKAKDETRSFSNTTVSSIQKRALNDPQKPLSHKEYVEDHIEKNSLPPGYVRIRAKNYILRCVPIRFLLSTQLTRK